MPENNYYAEGTRVGNLFIDVMEKEREAGTDPMLVFTAMLAATDSLMDAIVNPTPFPFDPEEWSNFKAIIRVMARIAANDHAVQTTNPGA
jgi:hypothetical protein